MRLLFYTLYIILLFFSCTKEENPVPKMSLNTVVIYNIEDDAQYSELRNLYESVYFNRRNTCDGYNCNGIVIFRAQMQGTHDDFRVYDRTCTFEADTCAMVIHSEYSEKLVCPCCGSVFNMIGEYMETGPAKFPLQKYDCTFYEGDLRIH
jgi:Rieske Fe-S protein